MNEHDNTDDLLKRMGEAHQRYSPNVDENALLMRALEGRRPARPRWAFAGWVVAALIVVGLIIRPMLPALGGGPSAEYTINGVKITTYHSDDEHERGTYYRLSWKGEKFFIALQPETYPQEPLVAEVQVGDTVCVLSPADVPLAESNLSEAKQLLPNLELVKRMAAQIERQKLWPADLWSIKPFIKKLSQGKNRVEYSGPMSPGLVTAAEMFVGNKAGYSFQGSGMGQTEGENMKPLQIRLYIWPDSFTLKAYAKPNKYDVYLSGDEAGYDAYQTPEWWGEGVREDLARIKHYLPQYTRLLPLLKNNVSPSFSQNLQRTTEQVIAGEPRALYRADVSLLSNLMEPWEPANSDEKELESQMMEITELGQTYSVKYKDITIGNRPGRAEMQIRRGSLELHVTAISKYWQVFYLKRDGQSSTTRLYVLNEGSLPKLESKLSPENESLLNDASSLASSVLSMPSELWPAGKFPKKYVLNWLKALSERKVGVWCPLGKTLIMMTIVQEGSRSELIINIGNQFKPELNLRLLPGGFELLNTKTGYLVTAAAGTTSEIMTKEAAAAPLNNEDIRQLKTVLEILNASKESAPSAVQSGITAFQRYLDNPVITSTEKVNELSAVWWSGKAIRDRTGSIELATGTLEAENPEYKD